MVQGGLTTSMELTANRRPFLYFPLRHHFEQNFHVCHRLDRHGAGRRMDFEADGPEEIAAAIAAEIGREVDYAPVETDGAARAAGPDRGAAVSEPASFTPTRELLDRLYRAAWALCGSHVDAEDLVQESFARVLARPRSLHGDDPAPYLMRTLRNTYLTGLRSAGRRPRTVALPADESTALSTTLARPDVAAEQRATLDAIAALPEQFRTALIAVDVLGLSYGEAAHALGAGEATITSRLFRARGRVARALSPEREGSVLVGV